MFLELSRHNQNILDSYRWDLQQSPNTQHLQPWYLEFAEIDPQGERNIVVNGQR